MYSSVVAWLVTCLGVSTVLSHCLSLGQSTLIAGIHFSHGGKVCMLGGESVKEKKTAASFVVTFIFIGYASRNTRWDKTETHKASQWLARLYMF